MQIGVVQVLTAAADGTLYLVPAYRFGGPANLQMLTYTANKLPQRVTVPATWYTLMPAMAPAR